MPHEYLDRYERWMRANGWTPRTRTQRLRMAARILEKWPDPGAVKAPELSEWLGRARTDGKDLTRASRATYVSDTRRFFGWLFDVGLIEENPADSELIIRPKVHAGVPRPLSAAEEERVLSAAHGNTKAWLLLALRAGLRASEIAGFRGEMIDADFVRVTGKGEKPAAIPTNPELWALAQDYPRRGWWFPSPAHDGHVAGASVTIGVGRHFRACGIEHGSIHRCRHSFATSLLKDGANLREVQELMRHSSPGTTGIYTYVAADRLREAVNRLGSRSA